MTSVRWSKPRPNASLASGPLIDHHIVIQTVVSEPDPVFGSLVDGQILIDDRAGSVSKQYDEKKVSGTMPDGG
jgi:hypothetical protein